MSSALVSSAKEALPILAELIPRGDGTYLLKPKLLEGGVETWITPQKASKLLGLNKRSIYRLLDPERPLLVHKRPLPKKILISLRSIHAYIDATRNPDFWSDPLQRQALEQEVSRTMSADLA